MVAVVVAVGGEPAFGRESPDAGARSGRRRIAVASIAGTDTTVDSAELGAELRIHDASRDAKWS